MKETLTHFNLNRVKEIVGDDYHVIFHLLKLTTQRIPQQIKDLRDFLSNQELGQAVSLSHNIKSNFRNIGLENLGAKAEKIEHLLRSQVDDHVSDETFDLIEGIEVGYVQAEIELLEWMNNYQEKSS